MTTSTVHKQFIPTVRMAVYGALVALATQLGPGYQSAYAFSFDGDPNSGSILLTTSAGASGGGEVIWLKHDSVSGIQGTGNNFNVSGDGGVADFPTSLAVGNFDGDNNGDILVGRSGGDLGYGAGLTTWVERSGASLTGVHNFTTTPVNSMAIGELGDGGFDDVIVGRDDGWITWLLKANGSDAITANHTFNQGAVSAVAIGNFDGDDNGDVLVAKPAPTALTSNWTERNSGDTLSGIHNFNVSSANSIAMGEPDGEGVDDAFIGRDDGWITWIHKNPTTDQITANSSGGNYNAGGVVDLAFENVQTGDPFEDLFGDLFVARPNGTVLWIQTDAVNRNMGAIDTITAAGAGSALTAIDAGDLDGDDDVDIVVGRSDGGGSSGSVGWYEVTDTGGQFELVERQQFFNVGAPVTDLQITPPGDEVISISGDYNGDGTVNAADYTAYQDSVGVIHDFPGRNPALSGTPVGPDDYSYWKDRFGNVAGTGSGAAVPEPASVVLLLAMMALVAPYQRCAR